VIFGLLNVINFAHGALFMMGAVITWMAMNYFGINYWLMLVLAPLVVGVFGVLIERLLLRWIYKLDHLYGLLLTLGLTLLIEGIFRSIYGVSGLGYDTPELLEGATKSGLHDHAQLPCLGGGGFHHGVHCHVVRDRKDQAGRLPACGHREPAPGGSLWCQRAVMITLTYAFGAGLAAFAGVLAAPVYQVSPLMGQNLIIVVFAVVVIGGMGSIMGSILTGLGLGVDRRIHQGVLSRSILHRGVCHHGHRSPDSPRRPVRQRKIRGHTHEFQEPYRYWLRPAVLGLLVAPLLGAYPVFVMKLMCFALFACAFNLLLGYTGMLSFGHAAFFGGSAYVAGQSMKVWGFTPEVGLLLGTASGALLGLVVGFFAIRRTGHLLHDDHAGAGADAVLLPADAFHRW
jgi:branched-subunit amino acid ABC-type transport system permease component